jgi:O-antigen/teichoic acid export membrane protein
MSHLYLNLFGENYLSGRSALFILCVGQLVNAATGSVGVLLNMTGHERAMVISVGMSAGLNICLNIFLIPRWGIDGAAVATIISLTFVNLVKVRWAYRYLGINVTCCGQLN